MPNSSTCLNADGLRRLERLYRDRLAIDPTDSRIRMGLAWCLLLRALYRSGQESMLHTILKVKQEDAQEWVYILPEPTPVSLVREALQQAHAASHLGPGAGSAASEWRLVDLVRLFGEEEALSEAAAADRKQVGELFSDL